MTGGRSDRCFSMPTRAYEQNDVITRRQFLKAGGAVSFLSFPFVLPRASSAGIVVNDVHSQLNDTRVHRIVAPESFEQACGVIRVARKERRALCIAGGRHAMGAQAFASDGILLDIRKLDRVLRFDAQRGTIEVESGIQWPALADYLTTVQAGRFRHTKSWKGSNRIPPRAASPAHRYSLYSTNMVALVRKTRMTIAAVFFVTGLATAETSSRYEGLQIPPLPAGHKEIAGFLIDDKPTSYYGVARIRHDSGEVIWLEKLLYRDNEGRPHWEIKSAVAEPKLEKGYDYFLGTCMKNGVHQRQIIALVKLEDKEIQTAIERAWWVDLNRESIFETLVSGITCYLEGWGHN